MTEVYKIINSIAPPIMNSLFQFRCNTNNIEILKKFRQNETVRYGTEIVTHRAPFGRIYTLNIKTLSQVTFTCSKSAIETVEKGVNCFES